MIKEVLFREAVREDLEALVALLADDVLGQAREAPGPPLHPGYLTAFEAIEGDPNHVLLVAERKGEVVGTLQLSFLPGLSHKGGWRGQIESVRIEASLRGSGIGRAFVDHAIGLCRDRGCNLVQLTTDKQRADARRFYEGLGFVASHEGMKRAP